MDKIKDIYNGLLPWEKADFCDWLFEKGELKDKIQETLDDKYEEWRLSTIENIVQNI